MSARAAAFAALLSACSRHEETPFPSDAPPATPVGSSSAPTADGPPNVAAPHAPPELAADTVPTATVRLLDPGRPPRRKLRYTWRTDRKETASVDLTTATSTEIAGEPATEIPLPRLHIAIAVDPREATGDGRLTYAWRVTAATVSENTATPSQVADGMRAEVATIEHLTGTAEVNALGISTLVTMDPLPPAETGATGQMVEQIRQILRDLAAPFPDEEVGADGRWEKLSRLVSKDGTITQTDTFRLVTLAGTKGTLEDVLAQTAAPQPLAAPGTSGVTARLDSMLASGSAKTRFDLTRLVPDTHFDGTTTMVVSSAAQAAPTRRLTMVMHIQIEVAGSPP